MLHKNLIFVLLGLIMISCSGTVPSVGNEVSVLETEESNEVAAKKEVSIELLNCKLRAVGNYTIEEITPESNNEIELPEKSITTYKPFNSII